MAITLRRRAAWEVMIFSYYTNEVQPRPGERKNGLNGLNGLEGMCQAQRNKSIDIQKHTKRGRRNVHHRQHHPSYPTTPPLDNLTTPPLLHSKQS